jgi:gliding motility-associated protein GldE
LESSSPDGGDPVQQLLPIFLQVAAQTPVSGLIIYIIIILVLLLCSALISGSEVAYFSLSSKDLGRISDEFGVPTDRILNLLGRPRYLLATILIANNVVNVSIVVLSYFVLKELGISDNFWLNLGINVVGVTFLLVMFGEVIPKIYATRYGHTFVVRMSGPLLFLRTAFKPVSYLLVESTKVIEKRLQGKRSGNGDGFDAEELEKAIDLTAAHQKSSVDEIKMLKGIVKFGNIQVKQIMHPRTSIVGLDESSTYNEMLNEVKEAGYSRLPVYRESLDNILGILYVKDLLEFLGSSGDIKWQDLIRPTYFVPETKKIDDLLKDIQDNRVHMVIAVDEYGGTAGMVTLEDILEEIIGDIRDEFDEHDEVDFEKLDDKNFLFEGRTLIHDLCKVLGVREDTFDKVRGDAESMGGLMLELAGMIPDEGKELLFDQYKFTIVSVGNNRVEKVKVTLEQPVYEG